MSNRRWILRLMESYESDDVSAIFDAINQTITAGNINRASMIIACTAYLGKGLADSPFTEEMTLALQELIEHFRVTKNVH